VYFPPYGWVPVDPTRSDKNGTHDYHEHFGMADNWLLVTQICGGPSRYLGWNYNSNREYYPDPEEGCSSSSRGGIWLIYQPLYPLKPLKPTGTLQGKINERYYYKSSTYDPFNSTLWYWWDWDDGTNSGWIGPYESNETCETSHSWKIEGSYYIKVKAKNRDGWESDWSDPLPVKMPKNKLLNFNYYPFKNLLDRFPNVFPILRHLLGLLN
jgi:hypothetical protein